MYVTRYRFYGQSPLSVLHFCSLLRLIITLFGMQTGAQNGAKRVSSSLVESPVSLVWLTQCRSALHLWLVCPEYSIAIVLDWEFSFRYVLTFFHFSYFFLGPPRTLSFHSQCLEIQTVEPPFVIPSTSQRPHSTCAI